MKATYVSQLVPRLQRLFGDISDIDLFLGGLMERPADDALLGPTFQCLVGDQFKRLKFGDRFWFEESGQPNSFTEGKENHNAMSLSNAQLAQGTMMGGPRFGYLV